MCVCVCVGVCVCTSVGVCLAMTMGALPSTTHCRPPSSSSSLLFRSPSLTSAFLLLLRALLLTSVTGTRAAAADDVEGRAGAGGGREGPNSALCCRISPTCTSPASPPPPSPLPPSPRAYLVLLNWVFFPPPPHLQGACIPRDVPLHFVCLLLHTSLQQNSILRHAASSRRAFALFPRARRLRR